MSVTARARREPWSDEVRARALLLRASGLMFREITELTGVPMATLSQWINDPDGSKLRARKDSYRGTCIDCGGPTSGGEGPGGDKRSARCADCELAKRHADAYWTRERIVAAIRRWAEMFGEPPSAANWNTAHPAHDPVKWAAGEWPHMTTTSQMFGRNYWSKAIRAAGFEPRPATGPPPGSRTTADYAHTVALYEEHRSLAKVGRILGITGRGVQERLKRAERLGLYQRQKEHAMPSYSAANAIDKDIAKVNDTIARLEQELAERRAYLQALTAAKGALNGQA